MASKVKRQRSSRANQRRAGGPGAPGFDPNGIQLEIDGSGRLRQVGIAEAERLRRKKIKKKNPNAEYYKKVQHRLPIILVYRHRMT